MHDSFLLKAALCPLSALVVEHVLVFFKCPRDGRKRSDEEWARAIAEHVIRGCRVLRLL